MNALQMVNNLEENLSNYNAQDGFLPVTRTEAISSTRWFEAMTQYPYIACLEQ
jgi:hypothetical protein